MKTKTLSSFTLQYGILQNDYIFIESLMLANGILLENEVDMKNAAIQYFQKELRVEPLDENDFLEVLPSLITKAMNLDL